MSAYATDPRVALSNGEAVVTGRPYNRKVIEMSALGWCVFTGPHMDLIGTGHTTMDAAIESLIGEPAVKS